MGLRKSRGLPLRVLWSGSLEGLGLFEKSPEKEGIDG
jgi:hypothetical protein